MVGARCQGGVEDVAEDANGGEGVLEGGVGVLEAEEADEVMDLQRGGAG